MPVYKFDYDDGQNPQKMVDQRSLPRDSQGERTIPRSIAQFPIRDTAPRDDIWFERQNVNLAEEIHESLTPGYRAMDRGIKNYFSGMQVPTKDGSRIMQVRVSGGDKPYLIWAQDLKRGRVSLPVMSIKRESDEFFFPKFSPAHFHHMARRYLDSQATRMELIFRPVPTLINYSLSVWGEHKRDIEYIQYQFKIRFNPAAEFYVEDEHIRGTVFMKCTGMTNAVDDDVPADQRANKRYDFAVTMEGWLPLPTKVVPTILGRVLTLKERIGSEEAYGSFLENVLGKQDAPVINVRS